MVESVYIRDKFATKEENIKQVVNSQLNRINTKVRELGTRIDDHGGQRIRNVGRPIDPADAANKEFVEVVRAEVHGEVEAVSEAVEAAEQNKNNMGIVDLLSKQGACLRFGDAVNMLSHSGQLWRRLVEWVVGFFVHVRHCLVTEEC